MPPLVRSRFDTPPTKALPKIIIKSLLSSFYLSFNPYKPYANADKQYFRLNINITVVTVYCINGYPKFPTMILPILTGVNIDADPPNVYACLDGVFVFTHCVPPFLLIHNPFYPLPLPRGTAIYNLWYKPNCKSPIAP